MDLGQAIRLLHWCVGGLEDNEGPNRVLKTVED